MSIELSSDLETAAKQAAGNWRRWQSFAWNHSRDADADRRFIVNTRNRDANLIMKSNHAAIGKALSRFTGGAHPSVRDHSASHWAVGWVEGFDILVYDRRGNITKAFREIHSIACILAEYPILDDQDHSNRECEAAWESLKNTCERFVKDGAPADWLDQVRTQLDTDGSGFEQLLEDPENHSLDDADAKAALKAIGLLDPDHDDDDETDAAGAECAQ